MLSAAGEVSALPVAVRAVGHTQGLSRGARMTPDEAGRFFAERIGAAAQRDHQG